MKILSLSKLLSLACLAVSGTMIASATEAGPGTGVSTGGANGTYTYTFNMPNDASFTLTTTGGPFGAPNSSGGNFFYTGTPDAAYTTQGSYTTTGNNTYTVSGDSSTTDGGFDVEIMLQYSLDGTYANRLDYYFTEPLSFWELTGSDLPFTTGDGKFIFGATGQTQGCTSSGCGITFGEVEEGASFAYTSADTTADPPCLSCTISVSFVPAASTSPVPEPSSLALLSTGVASAIGMYRKRRGSL